MTTAKLRLSLALLLPLTLVGCGSTPAEPDNGKPRLAVLVVFDQMRGDYLDRWRGQFGSDGFNRLRAEGAFFTNCRYPYACTVTAAGHAAVSTGCSPDRNGIVGNSWYDRKAGVEVIAAVPNPARKVASADGLLTPTAADTLKEATGGKGKVVAISLKDRSAVMPGGKRADACLWFSAGTGEFVTSTAYRETVPSWVKEFNALRRADTWFNQPWQRFRPDLDYDALSGPDDQAGEGKGAGQGVKFPHPMIGPAAKDGTLPRTPGVGSREAVQCSPFGNDLLLELAQRAIVGEQLGKDNTPDFLSISFSSNDLVGHAWGPDSQEVLDVTLRSDRIVAGLLKTLDREVGVGRYVLVLSADHGVCPLPEVSRAKGNPLAIRIEAKAVEKAAEAHLVEKFGEVGRARYIEKVSAPWVFLDHETLAERKIEPANAAQILAQWFLEQPGFTAAYTAGQLAGPLPADDAIGQAVRKGYFAERCGDLCVVTAPYSLYSDYTTGTSHGTPHDYDRHVPLIVFGAGVKPGDRSDLVTPQAAAVIWPTGVGTPGPAKAEAVVPAGLFVGK